MLTKASTTQAWKMRRCSTVHQCFHHASMEDATGTIAPTIQKKRKLKRTTMVRLLQRSSLSFLIHVFVQSTDRPVGSGPCHVAGIVQRRLPLRRFGVQRCIVVHGWSVRVRFHVQCVHNCNGLGIRRLDFIGKHWIISGWWPTRVCGRSSSPLLLLPHHNKCHDDANQCHKRQHDANDHPNI